MLAACVQCRQKKKLPISVPTTTLKRVGNTRAKTSPWVISCLKQQISFLLFHSSCEIQLVFIFSVCFYHYYYFLNIFDLRVIVKGLLHMSVGRSVCGTCWKQRVCDPDWTSVLKEKGFPHCESFLKADARSTHPPSSST